MPDAGGSTTASSVWGHGLQVICKATRAWAPPEVAWLFPARSAAFRSGGWYVEWPGHEQAGRRGWLHPGVLCLMLGFRALELEAGQARPWWLRQLAARLRLLRR